MRNRKFTGRKIVSVMLAAVLLAGSQTGECLAAEENNMVVSLTAETDNNAGEQSSSETFTQEGETDAVAASEEQEEDVDVTTSGSLMVTALSTKASTLTGKTSTKTTAIKLNFSYTTLGCIKVKSKLNVRTSRSTDAKISGTLSNNTFCNVLEVYEDGWAKIKSGKISGYVSTDYLLVGEKAQQAALKKAKTYAKISGTSKLNIRSLPTVASKVYGQVKKNKKVKVKYETLTKQRVKKLLKKNKSLRRQLSTKEKKSMLKANQLNQWMCVKYNGKTAFISKEFAKVSYVVKTGSTQSNSGQNKKNKALRAKIVKYAKKFVGNKYVYGGTSLTKGTDCSGFVMRIYQHFGYRLSRTSVEQSKNGKKTSRSKLQPGDLLFYKHHGKISHVTMYIGNGKVIHASNEKNGIMISNISYRKACRYVKIIKA